MRPGSAGDRTGHQRYTSGNRSRPERFARAKSSSRSPNRLGMDAQTRDTSLSRSSRPRPGREPARPGHDLRIIKQSEGSVLVDSTPGRGNHVQALLPSVRAEAAVGEEAPRPWGRRTGRILWSRTSRCCARSPSASWSARLRRHRGRRPGRSDHRCGTRPEAVRSAADGRGHARHARPRAGSPAAQLATRPPGAARVRIREEIVDSDRHEDPLLAKPFSPETLLAAVDAVMALRPRLPRRPRRSDGNIRGRPIPIDSIRSSRGREDPRRV